MKYLLILIVFPFSISTSVSQSVYGALNTFLSQDFFGEYAELRDNAESSVRQFKLTAYKYTDEEVSDVMHAYDASAGYFNAVLQNIKEDLLDKKKRKFMIAYPDDFAKKTTADLYKAREFYENTYVKEMMLVTDGEFNGMAFLAMLPQVIGYAKSAFSIYKKMKKQMDKFNNDLLNKHLIEKYRFKLWDEIE